jgi:hypothetical protein
VPDFLQAFAGYALTADTREECLAILHGDGRNGNGQAANVGHADYESAGVTRQVICSRILMADKTTKILLGLIVLGVWLNLIGLFRLDRNTAQLPQIRRSVDAIEDGTCTNSHLCPP